MSSSTVSEDVAISRSASGIAFEAGQLVERLLLQRSCELAPRLGSTVVTDEHVRSCLDSALLQDVFATMRKVGHGEEECNRPSEGIDRGAA